MRTMRKTWSLLLGMFLLVSLEQSCKPGNQQPSQTLPLPTQPTWEPPPPAGTSGASGSSSSSSASGSASGSSSGASPQAIPSAIDHNAWKASVKVHLERVFDGPKVVSFGVPIPKTAQPLDPSKVRVRGPSGALAELRVKPILFDFDKAGKPTTPRSILVQFSSASMPAKEMDVEVMWSGPGNATSVSGEPVAFAQTRKESPELAPVAERAIEKSAGGGYALVEKKKYNKTIFTGWEPAVIATFPLGFLADTNVYADVMARPDLLGNPNLKSLAYLSDAVEGFADGAIHNEGYAYKPEGVVDSVTNYEGWLYDRCASFLLFYGHIGQTRHLRHAYRACSYYGSKIGLQKDKNYGIFTGKENADIKYSHIRGLYMYYAMTGDEAARNAGLAIANMWLDEPIFAVSYRKGSARASDKLWTERLLAVDFEAMIYGFLLSGDARFLVAFKELFETAYKHITTSNQAELDAITKVHFPPQNCFIHSAQQHSEGEAHEPWCSGWMSELLIDPLQRYQELTGDARVDEIFIRLARSLRDAGVNYQTGKAWEDTFIKPGVCWEPGNDPRLLVPIYGFGIDAKGKRMLQGQYPDYEHCADATAMTAAAIRSLKRQNAYDKPGVGPLGPFKSEGESFMALHQELSYCAMNTFRTNTRAGRDPRNVKPQDLGEHYKDGDLKAQTDWLEHDHIGHPTHVQSPIRKLSWWFNTSLGQFRIFQETGMTIPGPKGGIIQGPNCPAAH